MTKNVQDLEAVLLAELAQPKNTIYVVKKLNKRKKTITLLDSKSQLHRFVGLTSGIWK